jgi:type VI protein secretion system component VasK
MKTKELYIVSFFSLFMVIFLASMFSSTITGMSVVSSNISIIGQAYKFTLEQYYAGGTLNQILLYTLIILIIVLITEIILLVQRSKKRTRIKKIQYMIDGAEHELKNKNFINARNIYSQITKEFEKLDNKSKEKIRFDCLDLYDKIRSALE